MLGRIAGAAMDIISLEQWERMNRAERIACCRAQVEIAEEASETAPPGRKEHYLEIAERWRALASLLQRP
jgi:hypothetical protein